MKKKIENLLEKIGDLMKEHINKREFELVTRFSPILSRVQELQRKMNFIEADIVKCENELENVNDKKETKKTRRSRS